MLCCREYALSCGGIEFKLTPELVSVKTGEKIVHVEEIIPNVIEPSFGIGRIMYAVFEHNFHVRSDDEQRTVSLNTDYHKKKTIYNINSSDIIFYSMLNCDLWVQQIRSSYFSYLKLNAKKCSPLEEWPNQ